MINQAARQLRRTSGAVADIRKVRVTIAAPAVRRTSIPLRATPSFPHHQVVDPGDVERAVQARIQQIANAVEAKTVDCRPNPYVDWEHGLTADGGYKVTYKDIDPSLLIKIGRVIGWLASMSCFVGFAANNPQIFPAKDAWLHVLVAGVLFYLLWRGPTYVFRSIEIAPDCIIVDDTDVFWAEFMELGPPVLRWEPDLQKATIAVTYGNRWVELVTTHRLDKFDRTPELLQAKLRWAFQQLWGPKQQKPKD